MGKIQLTEMRELVPPIMNEKATSVVARLGDPIVVPCANPKPVYRGGTATNLQIHRAKHTTRTVSFAEVQRQWQSNTENWLALGWISATKCMPYVRMMPKLPAVAGKTFFLKCPVAGYPIDSIIIYKDGVRLPTII
ncbi:uncharacterized protein LOC126752696 isoform X2 [Bactrocera neohumeralis]|uniref:uncharacterized protein LOC126752696 isoform X2 n=1 Tax=Bactrocera neohumeralis TaxID=98809 RepID=UPI002166025D|nr:uncharacterized protein LOC126752696 isoform X2 [Bactrocera neohumeralis]